MSGDMRDQPPGADPQQHTFTDRHDPACYLVVSQFDDGSVSLHGWNDNTDHFTAIDLSPVDAAELTTLLKRLAVVGNQR